VITTAFFVALFIAPSANAGAISDLATASAEAVKKGDSDSNIEFLQRAIKVAPDAEEVVGSVDLARLYQHAGLAKYKKGDKEDDSVAYFRQALMIDPELSWNEEVFNDDDAWTLFEALRRETSGKKQVSSGVPEFTGQAKIFIDGHSSAHGSEVFEGKHLVQITCPGGQVYGRWHKFGKPPKYRSMCPDGFGTVAALDPVAEPTGETDALLLFDEFGNPIAPDAASAEAPEPAGEDAFDAFGNPITPAAEAAEAAEAATAAAPVEATPAPAADPAPEALAFLSEELAGEPTPPPAVASGGGSALDLSLSSTGVMVSGGGAACLLVGAVMNFAIVNPHYTAVAYYRDNPQEISRDDADALTSRFRSFATMTAGIVGLGLAGTVGGFFIDDSHLGLSPNGVWLSTEF